jgi:hypothetical protein
MQLPDISDDVMRTRIAQARSYTLVLLRAGPRYGDEASRAIIWEHGRRNFALREQGALPIVCPVTDDSELCGMGIFDATTEETVAIMAGDPGVVAEVFTYEAHPIRGFPGSALP